jgi:hypothetical protein
LSEYGKGISIDVVEAVRYSELFADRGTVVSEILNHDINNVPFIVVGIHRMEELGKIEDVSVTHSPKVFEKDPIERLRQTVDSNHDIQLVGVEVIDIAQVVV